MFKISCLQAFLRKREKESLWVCVCISAPENIIIEWNGDYLHVLNSEIVCFKILCWKFPLWLSGNELTRLVSMRMQV